MANKETETGLRKLPVRRRKAKPFPWLREATPEEIGEAIMTVDPVKAGQVVAYIVGRTGPELASRVDAMVRRTQQDPAHALLGAFGHLLRGK